MSADFFSDVAVASAEACERWYTDFAARERMADLVGPDEENVELADLATLADIYKQRPPKHELGATYVVLSTDLWSTYVEAARAQHMSSSYATLVVIDRAIAIPHGISFLEGHAVRHVRNRELTDFQRAWRGLVLRCGGTRKMADRCRPWIDRGDLDLDELTKFLDAIATVAATAKASGDDLLLVGYPAP